VTPKTTGHCDFCNEFSGGTDNTFAQIYGQQPLNRIIFRSNSFAVVPSIGQLVEGHVLIIPFIHYTAIADMSFSVAFELSELCKSIRLKLVQSYGPCVLFEHGVRGSGAGGCGIDHAHLHAMPFTHPADPIVELRKRHRFRSISNLTAIREIMPGDSSYLYYEEVNSKSWIASVDFLPSQYLRRFFAEVMGVHSWNWRDCKRESAMIRAIEQLSDIFDHTRLERPTDTILGGCDIHG
jgi:diadenosine tetraphosphate (Ap4A) HIT family hydrolase